MAGRLLSTRACRALRRNKRQRPCGLQQLTPKTTKRPKNIDWALKPTKCKVNNFIPFAGKASFLIIDASNLGTATQCRKFHPNADIDVINSDPKIAEKANQMGHTLATQGCRQMSCGARAEGSEVRARVPGLLRDTRWQPAWFQTKYRRRLHPETPPYGRRDRDHVQSPNETEPRKGSQALRRRRVEGAL